MSEEAENLLSEAADLIAEALWEGVENGDEESAEGVACECEWCVKGRTFTNKYTAHQMREDKL